MNRKIKTIGKIIMFIMTAIALVSFVFCITYEITNIYIKIIFLLNVDTSVNHLLNFV